MPLRLPPLSTGHSLDLLEGSAEFFPALIAAIDAARHEVWLESYIFDFTGQSESVARALERASQRGVTVRVTVPRGPTWARMSDHLPLVADFAF